MSTRRVCAAALITFTAATYGLNTQVEVDPAALAVGKEDAATAHLTGVLDPRYKVEQNHQAFPRRT